MQIFKNTLAPALAGIFLFTSVTAAGAPASAQQYNYGNYGVANVSVANGYVVIVRADSGAQTAATINAPVVPGDYLTTGSGSDAEVQFNGTSMLRLANNTQVRFVNLNAGSPEVQLATGTVDLAQLQGSSGSAQVDTPALSVRPNQQGDYRVTVLGNGETLVTARSGSATVSSANGSQTITPGSTLVANGSSMSLQNAIGFDSFDQFNISRDQAVQTAYNANPYVSPQLAGYSNFANYGQWQNVPGYGYSWAPYNQNQNNFAPYQNGQWVWEPGYGYTWVDNAPYGYATSHYGSWFYNQGYGGWNWQPPGYQYQTSPTSLASAWLPAAVSFFLSGNNGSSLGGGGLMGLLGNLLGFLGNSGNNANIGWIPLAPGQPYQPWYGQNYTYPQTGLTNVPNITNIYNVYPNARYYRGITMVPVSVWRAGNFRHPIVMQPRQIRQIVIIRGAVPVVPTTANLQYTTIRTVRTPVVLTRRFSSARLAANAPVVTRIAFATQRARITAIAAAKPHVVALSAYHAPVHPVYQPVKRAPVHVTVIKPAPRRVTSTQHTTTTHHAAPEANHAAPAAKHAAPPEKHTAPAAKHETPHPAAVRHTPAPVVHHAPAPVVHHAPAPVVHHAPAPVVHHTPVPAPVVRHTPVPAPVVRHTPVPAPVVHRAPAPVKPEVHAVPIVRPTPHAVQKPAAAPQKPAAAPAARATAHPKPKATPGRD
ncbi:MAG TPA: DUF6600 domain-containing protein [Candidatus Baltobacteraceae bacterium]|nr:DUF6600 domain-containing protein [Candidatus Baltobacteraceae bacterium]